MRWGEKENFEAPTMITGTVGLNRYGKTKLPVNSLMVREIEVARVDVWIGLHWAGLANG